MDNNKLHKRQFRQLNKEKQIEYLSNQLKLDRYNNLGLDEAKEVIKFFGVVYNDLNKNHICITPVECEHGEEINLFNDSNRYEIKIYKKDNQIINDGNIVTGEFFPDNTGKFPIRFLNSEITDLKITHDEFKQKCIELDNSLKGNNIVQNNKTTDIEIIDDELKQKCIESYDSLKNTSDIDINDIANETRELGKKIGRLFQKKERLENRVNKLEKEIDELQEKKESLEKNINEFKQSINKKEEIADKYLEIQSNEIKRKKEDLEENINKFEQSINEKKEKADEYLKKQSDEIERKKEDLEENIIEFKQSINEKEEIADRYLKMQSSKIRLIKGDLEKNINEFKQSINESIKQINKYKNWAILIEKVDESMTQHNDSLKKNKELSQIIDDVWCYLWQQKNLQYDKSIIKRFLIALHTNQLIILWGEPGTGKTSLPIAVAEAVGGKCKIVSVQSNWRERLDLLGFYNTLEKRYEATPFLDNLVEAKYNPDVLYLIVLDEMNLAHIEYYFSDILSVLSGGEDSYITLYSEHVWASLVEKKEQCTSDVEKKEIMNQLKDLELYYSPFKIPKNVRFIGTLNMDATTKDISPKVIDRSYLIKVTTMTNNIYEEQSQEIGQIEGKSDALNAIIFSPCSMRSEELRNNELFKDIEYFNEKYLLSLNVRLSQRFYMQLGQLINGGKNLLTLDDVILDKILCLIKLDNDESESDNENRQIEIAIKMRDEFLNEKKCYKSIEKLNDMINQAKIEGDSTYWI